MFNTKQTTEDQQNFHSRGGRCGGPAGKKFGGMFGGKAPWMQGDFGPGSRKSANIEESETAFIISLYAAGLDKNNFKVTTADDLLTISYTAPANNDTAQAKYVHVEYRPQSFNRIFQLNGKVLTDQISAAYNDGILKVTLAKNPEKNKPAQDVKVD